MTGATGDLTPDDADQPFIAAEQRAMLSPEPEADTVLPDDEPEGMAGGNTPDESDGDEFSDSEERF